MLFFISGFRLTACNITSSEKFPKQKKIVGFCQRITIRISGKQLWRNCCWKKYSPNILKFPIIRSSYRRCSIKIGVLKIFSKFTGNNLRHNLFFNKVAGLRSATLFKKTVAQVFTCEFCKIFKNTFFTGHLRRTASE